MAQMVKCLSTMWETRVQSLGWGDPLEKEMAIHSSTIAWKIPWTEEPGRLQSMELQRVRHDWATSLSLSHLYLDEHIYISDIFNIYKLNQTICYIVSILFYAVCWENFSISTNIYVPLFLRITIVFKCLLIPF